MKHLKIIGVCLVAAFAAGMVAAGVASAAVWEQCAKGAAGTKYETNQCLKASVTGEWAWAEVKGTEKVKAEGTLTLKDTGTLIGTVEVTCVVTGEGLIGPKQLDKSTKVTVEKEKCKAGTGCEKVEEVKAIDLPWQTELVEESGKVRDRVQEDGAGAPGWLVKCKVMGITATDECSSKTGSTAMENRTEGGLSSVLSTYEEKSGKGNCTSSGKETGVIEGKLLVKSGGGAGIRVGGIPIAPPPSIEQVNFLNNIAVTIDHRENKVTEKALAIEEYGNTEKNVEWVAGTNKKNWPVAYPQNTSIKLEAQLSLEPATRTFLKNNLEAGSTVPVVGKMTLGVTTLDFEKSLTAAEVKKQLEEHEAYLIVGEMTSNIATPKEVHLYENGTKDVATIAWSWTVKSGGVAFEQSLGSSAHNLYLTAGTPAKKEGVAITNYLTVLDAATQGIVKEAAKQPPGETEIIKGVWSEYKTKSVGFRWYEVPTGTIHRGGKALAYYEEFTVGKNPKEDFEAPTQCNGTSGVAGLLEVGKNECGPWAEIFSYGLAEEATPSAFVEVAAQFAEPTEKCEELAKCIFLVNNWFFEGAGGLGGTFPYRYTEVKDTEGLPGQGGIQNPPSAWERHFVVEAKKGANALYDPSYGTGPFTGTGTEPLKKLQEASIAGFCGRLIAMMKCQKSTPTLQLASKVKKTFE